MATTLPTRAVIVSGTTTNAEQKVNFGDQRDFIADMLGTDSADKPAARTLLGVAPRATRIDVASVAGTVDLTSNAPNTDDIRITGALAITAFTVAVGRVLRVTAGGAFSLANNAGIVTQSGATLTLVAGDTFQLRATAANVVEVMNLSRFKSPASANQTITSGGALTIAHGLGREPSIVTIWLRCLTAEFGYTVGQKILANLGASDSALDDRGAAVVADATNIYIRYGANAKVFVGTNFTNGNGAAFTNTSWAMVIEVAP